MSDAGTFAYIARKPCGCVVMAAVDSERNKKQCATEVGKAIRLGETVERLPVETVRTMPWKCDAHRKAS